MSETVRQKAEESLALVKEVTEITLPEPMPADAAMAWAANSATAQPAFCGLETA